MNSELLAMFSADRDAHARQSAFNTPEYQAMRASDLARRERVLELVVAKALDAAEDYFRAAWIMNHGDTPADAWHAHSLALRASELGYGAAGPLPAGAAPSGRPASARWLAAASYDRWQMYQGKPQKFGTNYLFDGRKDRLWDVDPQTSDAERAAWDVPPLAEQLRKAEEANRQRAPLPEADARDFEARAPAWARAALKKWRDAEGGSSA